MRLCCIGVQILSWPKRHASRLLPSVTGYSDTNSNQSLTTLRNLAQLRKQFGLSLSRLRWVQQMRGPSLRVWMQMVTMLSVSWSAVHAVQSDIFKNFERNEIIEIILRSLKICLTASPSQIHPLGMDRFNLARLSTMIESELGKCDTADDFRLTAEFVLIEVKSGRSFRWVCCKVLNRWRLRHPHGNRSYLSGFRGLCLFFGWMQRFRPCTDVQGLHSIDSIDGVNMHLQDVPPF